ncbi:MAG: DUF167 domain-containing protein [Gammaproteobacteria bacterium]
MAFDRWYERRGDDLIIHAHLLTRSKTDKADGIYGNRLKLHITAPPVDGKANKQLITFLAKAFGVAKSRINIARGKHSQDKTVVIHAPKREPEWFQDLLKQDD